MLTNICRRTAALRCNFLNFSFYRRLTAHLEMGLEAVLELLSGRVVGEETEAGQRAVAHVDRLVQGRHEFQHRRRAVKTHNLKCKARPFIFDN